jgi:folate-dependent tRNA-U54 methylase TrmFO/GidA
MKANYGLMPALPEATRPHGKRDRAEAHNARATVDLAECLTAANFTKTEITLTNA